MGAVLVWMSQRIEGGHVTIDVVQIEGEFGR